MPKISVIVPVYNAERYIKKCIESILSQTYSDIECLLIDDGSKDLSGHICDEYTLKDKRVRVVHQENKGELDARAEGVRISQGEWLYFVDSDDIIMSDTLDSMLSYVEEGVDVVAFESQVEGKFSKVDYAKILLGFQLLPVWGKLYRRCLFNDYVLGIPRFFKVGEDFLTNLRLLSNIKGTVVCKAQHKYIYNRSNPESVQLKHISSYAYERSMILEVGMTLTAMPEYSAMEQAHFKWLIAYLGGMIGLRYQIDYRENWIKDIQTKSQKFPLSWKDKMVISAININVCRWVLVVEKSSKRFLRNFLRRFV